jgi:hypothetical protein
MAERRDFTADTQTGRARVPQPVSLRFRPGLRDQVHVVAAAEGKSLTEAVNDLIERGLTADQRLADVFGSPAGFAVARALLAAAEAAALQQGADQGRWLLDPEHFSTAAAALCSALDSLRPRPEVQSALAEIERSRKRQK